MPKTRLDSQSSQLSSAFWDTSAIVPLCCWQSQTPKARQAYRLFSKIYVWWGTRVECVSALQRLEREQYLTAKQPQQALQKLDGHCQRWVEIAPLDEVRFQAERLLRTHQLRAADSLQLAAALVWCNLQPKGRTFVCDDGKLLMAAEKEGFNVIHV